MPTKSIYHDENKLRQWTQKFTATKGEDGLVRGSHEYWTRKANMAASLPGPGSPCVVPGFDFLKSTGWSIDRIEGGYVYVSVEFAGIAPGSSSGSEGFSNEGSEKPRISGSVTQQEESIFTHKKFKDVPAGEIEIIKNVLAGNFMRNKSAADKYQFIDATDAEAARVFEISNTEAIELYKLVAGGVEAYLVPHNTHRKTYVTRKLPTNGSKVCTIDTPDGGAPSYGDRNWLSMGYSYEQIGDDLYRVSEEWLSGDWNSYLYSKE
jgi:hypothetical protein